MKFVLNLFTSKTTTGGFFNSAEQSRVRATFGQIPSRSDLQRADVLVARLSRGLKPDVIRALCDEDSAVYNGPAVAASARTVECSDLSKAQLFGSDIAVNPPDYRTPHFNLETALGEEEHVNFSDSDFSTASTSTSSSDFEADDRADDAIQSLWPALSEAAHSSSKAGRPVAPLAAERSLRDPVAQVLRTLPRFSLDDALLESVERSVLTHLSSSQSDDAIQNDLLELVGFEPEELECVGELIRLRADLQLVRKSTGASKTVRVHIFLGGSLRFSGFLCSLFCRPSRANFGKGSVPPPERTQSSRTTRAESSTPVAMTSALFVDRRSSFTCVVREARVLYCFQCRL